MSDYEEVYEMLSSRYDEVDGYDFYRELFPNNAKSTDEMAYDFSKPYAIFMYPWSEEELAKKNDGKSHMHRCVIYEDTWEDQYQEYIEGASMALCSGLVYRQRSNTLANAQAMNALVFDLDSVGRIEMENLFERLGKANRTAFRALPMPTYLVMSGSGLHLYYVFENPIDLYPNIKVQLKSLKYDLTRRLWDREGTTKERSIQYQSICQSFRMVGSINEKYGTKVAAFRTGEKVSIDYLNQYVYDKNNCVDLKKPLHPSKMTRLEALEKYPDWYQHAVVEKNFKRKKWDIQGKVHGDDPLALYHWWLRHIDEVEGGHRYFYMMCTAIYAYKCDVTKEQLREDLTAIFKDLSKIQYKNALTMDDVESALEAYDREFFNFTVDDISKLTNITIEKNRRNGRKQADHMQIVRAVQAIQNQLDGRDWREGNGRPDKKDAVLQWREKHPGGRQIDCHRETGISRPTIAKWWNS